MKMLVLFLTYLEIHQKILCGEKYFTRHYKKYLYSLICFRTCLATTKNVTSGVPTDNIYQAKLNIELWRKSYR